MSNVSTVPAPVASPQPPRLLDRIRQAALTRFARPEPGERYAEWVRRFILFHGKRHPRELALGEVGRFLEHLAQSEKDPLRAIEQARGSQTHRGRSDVGPVSQLISSSCFFVSFVDNPAWPRAR